MEEEKRKRTRVPVHFDATVKVGGATIPLETENISLRAMLCGADERLVEGGTGDVQIVLSPEAIIAARGKILRSNKEGVVIIFEDIDEDSFFHLKQLLQYNADDADRIDQELTKAGM